jgi:hypothetical protein
MCPKSRPTIEWWGGIAGKRIKPWNTQTLFSLVMISKLNQVLGSAQNPAPPSNGGANSNKACLKQARLANNFQHPKIVLIPWYKNATTSVDAAIPPILAAIADDIASTGEPDIISAIIVVSGCAKKFIHSRIK